MSLDDDNSKVVSREWYPEETEPIPGMESCRMRHKTVNIVMTANVSHDSNATDIDLSSVAMMMPMLDILGFNHKPNTKLKIPYYGFENAVVSIRYGTYYRGVRVTAKPLKNNIYIDLQLRGKNQHLKVSSKKIHITGVRTEDTGSLCISVIKNKINNIIDRLEDIRNLDDKESFIKLCHEDDIPENHPHYDLLSFVRVNKELRSNVDTSAPDHYSYDEFVNNVVNGALTPCNKHINILDQSLRNQVFYVNVCFEICLVTLCKLITSAGHGASFNNWNKIQYANIKIKTNNNGPDCDELSNISKIPLKNVRHVMFKVNGNGGINIWSTNDNNISFKAFRILSPLLALSYKSPGSQKRKYDRKTPRNQI
jgi:uncharacterized membrane protein